MYVCISLMLVVDAVDDNKFSKTASGLLVTASVESSIHDMMSREGMPRDKASCNTRVAEDRYNSVVRLWSGRHDARWSRCFANKNVEDASLESTTC